MRVARVGRLPGKLPARQRAVVERRYYGGESVNQIGDAENKPPNAIAALLYRARKLLATCMAESMAENGEPA